MPRGRSRSRTRSDNNLSPGDELFLELNSMPINELRARLIGFNINFPDGRTYEVIGVVEQPERRVRVFLRNLEMPPKLLNLRVFIAPILRHQTIFDDFRSFFDGTSRRGINWGNIDDKECAICLDDITHDDDYITTCGHMYHRECWDHHQRIPDQRFKCPKCRRNVRQRSRKKRKKKKINLHL